MCKETKVLGRLQSTDYKRFQKKSAIPKYLVTLQQLYILPGILPIEGKIEQKEINRLSDVMFKLWYRFIPR